MAMSELDKVYSDRIMELAAAIPRTARLASPQVTATAHSKLCGSTITVDLNVEGDRVVDFGQNVRACLLGQASASIVGREIVGQSFAEIRRVASEMSAMLKAGGPVPQGAAWVDFAALQPVREHKGRHASTLLIFEALEKAMVAIEGQRRDATATLTAAL
jgi:NifU-like protein involved in Fe-S cluster formation